MNNDYNGTATYDELWNVLGDEAIGHAKYTLYGRQAEKEGRFDAARLFYRLANDELGHAEMWMNELGMTGDTASNVENAITDEVNDYENNYPYAADKAEKEGFDTLSEKFLMTADVEKRHGAELRRLNEEMKSGMNGRSLVPKKRRCLNCGYTAVSEELPENGCPLCGYSGGYLIEEDVQ
ncbi:MAG: rubrerythrin family protein [Clostridia bacterium]|nr:rubrerythrin family protein [Clostridia bacterium]